jgi:hypothetical protein
MLRRTSTILNEFITKVLNVNLHNLFLKWLFLLINTLKINLTAIRSSYTYSKYNYSNLFSLSSVGVKRPGREADPSPLSSASVKEYMELYLHSPTTLSWRGALLRKITGTTLHLLLLYLYYVQRIAFRNDNKRKPEL